MNNYIRWKTATRSSSDSLIFSGNRHTSLFLWLPTILAFLLCVVSSGYLVRIVTVAGSLFTSFQRGILSISRTTFLNWRAERRIGRISNPLRCICSLIQEIIPSFLFAARASLDTNHLNRRGLEVLLEELTKPANHMDVRI